MGRKRKQGNGSGNEEGKKTEEEMCLAGGEARADLCVMKEGEEGGRRRRG